MNLALFQIDAFTDKVFGGNPAAVIPLTCWLADETMQQIAMENNLSETVFICGKNNNYEIRWFTPLAEVNLCGHATVAAAHYLYEIAGISGTISFASKSGPLTVTKSNSWYFLDFPSMELANITEIPAALITGLGKEPKEVLKSIDDWQLVYETPQEIEALDPDFNLLRSLPARGIIATAPAIEKGVDFVSRFFAPAVGINEDPVTGSAHTKLIPYWSKRLNKTDLIAKQLSKRGGLLKCSYNNDRVLIGGQAKLYMIGNIYI